jgi:hypothetical protein
LKDLLAEFAAKARRWQDDFDALQDELAGQGTSRQARLGRKREEVAELRKGRTFSDITAGSALQLLLANDPEYRALYEQTWDRLTEAEAKADAAIADLEAKLAEQQDALDDIERSAASLPDGTKVFRAVDGSLKTVDGQDVSHLADHVAWKGDEPSWEDYITQRDRVVQTQDRLDAWRHYQVNTLGRARDRLSDQDNPPSAKELEDIMQDIEAEQPKRMDAEPPKGETVAANVGVSNTSIPAL